MQIEHMKACFLKNLIQFSESMLKTRKDILASLKQFLLFKNLKG